jgi:hypothetical protein
VLAWPSDGNVARSILTYALLVASSIVVLVLQGRPKVHGEDLDITRQNKKVRKR